MVVPYVWPHGARELFELRLDPSEPAGYVMSSYARGNTAVAQWRGGALDTHAVDLGGALAGTADFDEDGRSDVVVLLPSDSGEPNPVGLWLSSR